MKKVKDLFNITKDTKVEVNYSTDNYGILTEEGEITPDGSLKELWNMLMDDAYDTMSQQLLTVECFEEDEELEEELCTATFSIIVNGKEYSSSEILREIEEEN